MNRAMTVVWASSLLWILALAQPPEMATAAKKFGASAKANAAELKQYSWTMRVGVTLKGEPKPPKVYTMRFDLDGKLQKTQLSADGPVAPPPSGGGGRLKEHVKEKKIAEAKQWAGELADLTKSYLTPSPALMETFFGQAQTVAAPDGATQVYAENLLVQGDKLVYEIDPSTAALQRSMFHSILDGDPIDGTVEFATLPAGPRYAARTTVNAPAKQLTATIENFNYIKQ
jgi:hypothetical protein